MASRFKKRWSTAQPVIDPDGARHASKLEKRVYEELVLLAKVEGWQLFRQVRMPLLGCAPHTHQLPLYLSIDFCLVRGDEIRFIDAKSEKRRSREWLRGQKALRATTG